MAELKELRRQSAEFQATKANHRYKDDLSVRLKTTLKNYNTDSIKAYIKNPVKYSRRDISQSRPDD